MNDKEELTQIQEECRHMAKMLRKLQKQEISLKSQNKILAREALNLGYHDTLIEQQTQQPQQPQQQKENKKKKQSPSKSSQVKQKRNRKVSSTCGGGNSKNAHDEKKIKK